MAQIAIVHRCLIAAAIVGMLGCGARSQQRFAEKSPANKPGRIRFSSKEPGPAAASRDIRLASVGGAVEPLTITRANFEEAVLNSPTPVLIDCWAPWCGPCRKMGPVVDSLAAEYDGRVVVAKLDIEACPEIARRYGVTSIPAFLYFQNGEVVDRVVGAVPRVQLERKLAALAAPVQTVSGQSER